jgi:hypothetical protein
MLFTVVTDFGQPEEGIIRINEPIHQNLEVSAFEVQCVYLLLLYVLHIATP